MPTVWFSLKKSLHCKSSPSEVHDPKSKTHLASILTRKPGGRSGCSRSIANLKDVIHGGSKRHSAAEKPVNCSPRSIGSSEFLNPITHEVILSDSRCELKITGSVTGCVGTLMPGTPGPISVNNFKKQENVSRRNNSLYSLIDGNGNGNENGNVGKNGITPKGRISLETESNGGGGVTCHKCGKQFGKWENLEAHHLSNHAGNFIYLFIISLYFNL